MIKFTAEDLKKNEYTHTLLGNDGEEQLVVITSWGQDRRSTLVVVSARCDSGVVVLFSSGRRMLHTDLVHKLGDVIAKWAATGIAPTPEEAKKSSYEQLLLLAAFNKAWHYG